MNPDLHVVALSGNPVFPRFCANCCAAANRHLTVSRVFRGDRVTSLRPFFCAPCIDAHRAETRPDPALFFRRLLHGKALWIPVFGSAWAISTAIRPTLSSLLQGDWHSLALTGALVLFFALIALGCMAAIWRGSRHLAVKPATSITASVQFTADLSQTFEPAWRRFTLRHPAYAELFRHANRHLLWSRGRPESQRAMVLRHYGQYALYALLGLLALLAIAGEFGLELW
ncbi:MAG: hypothetical protein JNK48_28845 [Bryobacterales bacterium]|nr:hypothetical protein [Bryobacterales bacterium]